MNRPTPSPTASGGGDDEASEGRSQKRASWDDCAQERSSKRRASRACLSCRNRKVRCDVVGRGVPCTNCRLDGVDCVVTESNRGRRPTSTTISSTNATASATITAAADTTIDDPPVLSPSFPSLPDHGPSPANPEPPGCPGSQIPSPPAHADEYLVSLSFEEQHPNLQSREASSLHPHELLPSPSRQHQGNGFIPAMDLSTGSTQEQLPARRDTRLPVFIRPLPPRITPCDLEYLANKDALNIPDDALRNELLRAYAEIVHPFMPAVDLHAFLDSVLEPRPQSVSLLLFQAVMFASIAFVDVGLLQSKGYSSRKVARKVFFNRVRLLYGLDCETDRLVLVQSLLLMTYWYDNPADEKDTWYWMGIALTLAQVGGLHRDQQELPLSSQEKRLRRRIWWSCVLRDRLLALGVRRPSRIRDNDFDVPFLSVDDFDLSPASDAALRVLGKSRMTLYNPEARAAVAALCVDLSKLANCIGRILHSQYTIGGSQAVRPEYPSHLSVFPKRSEQQSGDLVKCDDELAEWVRNQDSRSRYTPVSDRRPQTADRIIQLHQSLLHMIYLTAVGVLHRPAAFCSGAYAESDSTRRESKRKVTQAAIAMNKLAFDLEANNQLLYLSTSSVPAFLSAALIHLLEIRSSDEEVRNMSIGRFYQCIHILHQLRDTYASADHAFQFLEKVLRATDINVPMLQLPSTVMSRNQPDSSACPSSSGFYGHASATNASQSSQVCQPLLSPGPIGNIFDLWHSTGSGSLWQDDIQLPGDILAGSPQLASWADFQGLIPTTM
ncbi:hypothetical protein NW762_012799 [Fusarium torreyae]|uniref:Zn(2)-C6 fungal-type domain-containing protein n=1 Tax=Fusarium torreyae TaxID=1237075 RepID=A0A9W8RNP1_9HYPO|nr:hypothetical protein NW762_012799 [Fusarium torreyae]